jgi:two-component system cell cycle sensor histidine kinase/response regulator CckA
VPKSPPPPPPASGAPRRPVRGGHRRLREALGDRREAQKLETLGLLVGGVVHDLNNVLFAIQAQAHQATACVAQGRDPRPALDLLDRALARSLDLTRHLLEFAGHDRPDPEPVDVAALIRDMADILAVAIPKRIALSLALAPDLPPLSSRPGPLRQVLLNLITNAVDAQSAGPGRIHIGLQALPSLPGPRCGRAPGLCLEVADAGCGMSPETLARIFEPFYTTKQRGRGLGLSTLRSIVRDHGGDLEVQSHPGAGSTFRVYLPFTPTRA